MVEKMTLAEAWKRAKTRLLDSGVDEAEGNAELLLLHVLDISKAELLRDLREPLPEAQLAAYEQLVARKAAGEPLQYLTGEQYFYGRRFVVAPGVLIPRPETELLAEAVLAVTDKWMAGDQAKQGAAEDAALGCSTGQHEIAGEANLPKAQPVDEKQPEVAGAGQRSLKQPAGNGALNVLDVGTGSGALAVTLAAERPSWQVTASDLSPDALAMAKGNAELHGAQVSFVEGDLLKPFMTGGSHAHLRIDVLVSNPPYIPSADMPGLQREVREHEPHLALDGGPDGLAPYRMMAQQLSGLASMPRLVAWEMGIHQAEAAAAMLREAADWDEIRFVKDYAGIDRHVLALKR